MKKKKLSLHNKRPQSIQKVADEILSLWQLLPEPAFLSQKDHICFDLKRAYDSMPDKIAVVVVVLPGGGGPSADLPTPSHPGGQLPESGIPSDEGPSVDYGVQVVGGGIENEEKKRVLTLAKQLGCSWALEISTN